METGKGTEGEGIHMNIDMTIDYDNLLEEAKKRYEKVLKYSDETRSLFIFERGQRKKYRSVQKKYLAARDEFLDWEKKNIDNLGVRLITDFHNSAPIGISAVISGHDNFGGGTLDKIMRKAV